MAFGVLTDVASGYPLLISELTLTTAIRATAKLVRNLHNNPDAVEVRLIVSESTMEAVRSADIVTTVTADQSNSTIITPDMLAPAMYINGVGGDCHGKPVSKATRSK